jgi:hypothetical protein
MDALDATIEISWFKFLSLKQAPVFIASELDSERSFSP